MAGGMADGTIVLYDPNAILEGRAETALVATIPASASSGPIAAMQFSPLDTHLLCAGAFNGRVVLWDCTNPATPTSSEPGPAATQSQGSAEITSVAWNTAVAHIVATAAGDGVVTVWDIQSRKAWCEIRAESAGSAVAHVAWNPAQGLHLLTASADDRNPVLRVWDLGASTSVPLATLTGHSAGLFRAAWCPHDDTLLLSVAKDNRTLLWDLCSLQAVAELPMDAPDTHHVPHAANPAATAHSAGALFASGRPGLQEQKQLRYDIKWSPFQRGIALTCSLDKKVQIHSLLALATYAGRPPAWMKPKASISTGFGGLLVSCGAGTGSTVTISTVPEQPLLVDTCLKHETDLAYYQGQGSIIDFCKIQQQNATSIEDVSLWGFMQVVFETNARQELLLHLGFDPDKVAEAASKYSDEPLVNGDADGTTTATTVSEATSRGGDVQTMAADVQEVVKRALLVGNFAAAVECCFHTGSYADALLLASCGGGELWAATQERYFAQQASQRPFLSLVSGIIRNEWQEFVSNSDITTWQETLAVISTYAQAETFPNLCILLGDRLYEAGEDSNASLCYMCSLNLQRSVLFWKRQLDETSDPSFATTPDLLALHEFVVKVSIFMQAAGPSEALTPEIEDLFTKYSKALAEQGLLVTATKYCLGAAVESGELRDRLYRSRASHRCYAAMGSAPEFPFTMVDVQQSRGQVLAQPIVQPESVVTSTNGLDFSQNHAYGHAQENHQQGNRYSQHVPQNQSMASDALPPGWVAIVDPNSGSTYYANANTGQTTWDKPQLSASAPNTLSSYPVSSQMGHDPAMDSSLQSQQQTAPTSTSKPSKASLASKYGDGFVSSASNPELAYQYGNVGTSNPYGDVSRPGTAAAVLQTPQKQAPISGSLNFDSLQLSNHHNSIKDTLLAATAALEATALNPIEKRQLSEAEKGIAILVKKLARDGLSGEIVEQVFALVDAVSQRDFATALAIQTTLANSEWRDHKDWLKGVKVLIQLAAKRINAL
jgi:protein transport protein SEC31